MSLAGQVSGEKFPLPVGRGSSVGISHATNIVEMIRGEECRWVRRGQAQRRWRIERVESKQDLDTLRGFITRHGGSRDAFFFRDPLDYTTASDHTSTPSTTDQWIGVGDGSTKTFTLVKRYGSGTQFEQARRCFLIENGAIAINDGFGPVTQIPSPSVFTIEPVLGTITFVNAPAAGSEITAGWEFHNICRFGPSTDEELGEVYTGYESGEVSVEIIEDKLGYSASDRMKFGGTYGEFAPKAHEMLRPERGDFGFYFPTSPITLYLPDVQGEDGQVVISYARSLVRGGPYFTIFNGADGGVYPAAEITLVEVYTDGIGNANYRALPTKSVIKPGQALSVYVSDAPTTSTETGQVWVAQ